MPSPQARLVLKGGAQHTQKEQQHQHERETHNRDTKVPLHCTLPDTLLQLHYRRRDGRWSP
jgi:hypothetical protein